MSRDDGGTKVIYPVLSQGILELGKMVNFTISIDFNPLMPEIQKFKIFFSHLVDLLKSIFLSHY